VSLDLDALRAPFTADGDPTIGVEEEWFLVDPGSGGLVWDAPALVAGLDDPRFTLELASAQVEHVTAPFADLDEVARHLPAARADLLAATPGRAYASAGAHPLTPAITEVPDLPRYHRSLEVHAWATRQQLVSALQVHVAVGDADVALAVHDALRSHLPLLTALAAAAPVYDGADTGLASVRPLVMTLLPRQGIPPALGSWERYADLRRWMEAAGVGGEGRLWWEVRLRPAYGTIELRSMDAQPTAGRSIALVALATCLVTWLAERARDGEPLPVHAPALLEENRWRALHRGAEAELHDLDTGEAAPVLARLGTLLESLAPTADRLGAGPHLEALLELARDPLHLRMREVAAAHGAEGLVRWLVERFAE
jgi:glutamate---cysteine ligase / carboxylate-amine ligase